MAVKLKDTGNVWHTDLEGFMTDLFVAKNTLAKGYWCMDNDVKYLNLRIDTRDLGYLLHADGRGPAENMGNQFRISPDAVRAAIQKWRDKYHDKSEVTHTPWKPESHWDEHDRYFVKDWQYEVENSDTRQSYIEWVNSQIEAEGDE